MPLGSREHYKPVVKRHIKLKHREANSLFISINQQHQDDEKIDERADRAIIRDQTYGRLETHLDVNETCLLAEFVGAVVVSVIHAVRNKLHPATFIVEGKIAQLKGEFGPEKAGVVIVNYPVTPVQERNIEHAFKYRILYRIRLILDIFSLRHGWLITPC